MFSDKLALADSIGFNCGIGSVHMKSVLEKCKFPKDVFVLAAPNAGYAETFSSRAVFLNSAGYFGDNMAETAELGVDIVGGCCGTMPSFIREMRKRISGKKSAERISKEEYERTLADAKKSVSVTNIQNGLPSGAHNKLKEKLLRDCICKKRYKTLMAKLENSCMARE